MADELEREIEQRVAALGYDLVELERAGSKTRPILRVRIESPGLTAEGGGVTVEDCTRVSRGLEEYLDEAPDVPEHYMLEVSSPGVERPLVRPADYTRFAGKEIAVKTSTTLADGSKRVEGELLGIELVEGEERVRVRKADGAVVDIPRADVARANLIFRWKGKR